MTTAIGVVITDHLVSGRLVDFRLAGKTLRYPTDSEELDALSAIPGGDVVELIATQIANLAAEDSTPVDAIGVAVPGIVRHGVVEDSPNLTQLKGMRMAEELTRVLGLRGCRRCRHARTAQQTYARLDPGKWHRLRPLALRGRRLGGRSHHGHARHQREVLRLRRRRPP